MRRPALLPYVALFVPSISAAFSKSVQIAEGAFDVREVESIACAMGPAAKKKKPVATQDKKPGDGWGFGFHTKNVVFGLNRAADWQAFALENISGSTLKTFEGQSYVQLASIQALETEKTRIEPCLRFPNPKTIIVNAKGEIEMSPADRLAFFDDTLASYPWANCWPGVDGGLITLLFDNRTLGWVTRPEEELEQNEPFGPLVEHGTFFAVGLDWADDTDLAAIRVVIRCRDRRGAEQVQQALKDLLSLGEQMIAAEEGVPAETRELARQFFSSAKVELSDESSDEQSVRASAEFTLSVADLIKACSAGQK